jgi:hypothetical protein
MREEEVPSFLSRNFHPKHPKKRPACIHLFRNQIQHLEPVLYASGMDLISKQVDTGCFLFVCTCSGGFGAIITKKFMFFSKCFLEYLKKSSMLGGQ